MKPKILICLFAVAFLVSISLVVDISANNGNTIKEAKSKTMQIWYWLFGDYFNHIVMCGIEGHTVKLIPIDPGEARFKVWSGPTNPELFYQPEFALFAQIPTNRFDL